MNESIDEVRHVLQRFQDGYVARDLANLDEFMKLFAPGEDTELIGIGATTPNGNEWFRGTESIREIIESDWEYWGNVKLDVANAKITVEDNFAWLSTTGAILQTQHILSDDVTDFTLNQMREILEDEAISPESRIIDATHFGLRRWRERVKPVDYQWPFVFTAVLVRRSEVWQFHMIHWSMPVD